MKTKTFLLALFLGVTLLVSCGNSNKDMNNATNNGTTTENKENTTKKDADVVSSASLATDEATLQKALKDSWIVILKNDISTSKDLVMEGDFTKPDKNDATKMVPAGRNLSIFDRDENKNTTASYTLTVPKLTIKSKDTKIEGGTIIGDVYVEADGLKLKNTKIEGNIYFSKQEYKDSYKIDENSTVTGVQEVK